MRRLFIAGNWKMNLNRAESVALAEAVAAAAGKADADLAVCPATPYVDAVSGAVRGTSVALGAQNMYFEAKGAFTGEASPTMLVDLGCKYVILGHSERRAIFGECDELINKKTHAAFQYGLLPIVCVGETLEEREAGRTEEVVGRQFAGSLAGLSDEQMAVTTIAYEPVWAIGTGKTASPEQAEEVHAHLRKLLTDTYTEQLAQQVRIQYGGSVKPSNAKELMSQPNVDGALVGGASLAADDFLAIAACLA